MNESGISWENVDISAIPELFNTAVAMESPEEAEAFYKAVVEFGEARFGGLVNKYAWDFESFDAFTSDNDQAMAIEPVDGGAGLYYSDAGWYRDHGYQVIKFSEIYHESDSNLEESNYPIEDLWR